MAGYGRDTNPPSGAGYGDQDVRGETHTGEKKGVLYKAKEKMHETTEKASGACMYHPCCMLLAAFRAPR